MSKTIALVDDDRNILTSISMALEREGYKVQTYIDGQSALVGLSRNPPDLAVVDLKMPKPILFEDVKDELSPIAQSFWMENRRVSNKLLCETLGYKLIYKNYKLGLKNCYLKS